MAARSAAILASTSAMVASKPEICALSAEISASYVFFSVAISVSYLSNWYSCVANSVCQKRRKRSRKFLSFSEISV